MKLLIIDDEVDLLSLAQVQLSRAGIEAFTAHDLTTARRILASHEDISGIVCDLFLDSAENGMDFFENEISLSFQGKFILVSGSEHADPRIAKCLQTHPRYGFFIKPYSWRDVLDCISSNMKTIRTKV